MSLSIRHNAKVVVAQAAVAITRSGVVACVGPLHQAVALVQLALCSSKTWSASDVWGEVEYEQLLARRGQRKARSTSLGPGERVESAASVTVAAAATSRAARTARRV